MTSVFNEKNYLWVVFGCITSLFILGAIAIWDVTPAVMQHHATPVTRFHWLGNHSASFIAGILLLLFFRKMKLCPVKRTVAWPLGVVAIIILTLTLVVGIGLSICGARRHIALFGYAIYVGPWAIIMLMPLFIYLFDTVKTYKGTGRFLYSLGIITLILFVNTIFLFQPDVRMNFLFNVIIMLVFLKTGDRKKRAYILAGVLLVLIAVVYGYAKTSNPYTFDRMSYGVSSFYHYDGKHYGGYFEDWLAMRDLKAGGLFGSGLGHYSNLRPSQNPYTDAMFLIITGKFPAQITAREFGLVGVSLIFVLYGGLFFALFEQIRWVVDKQRRLLGYALLLFLAIQAFFPLLRVIHVFPFAPYQMPFMGYEVRGMILSCITVGLILGLVRNRPAQEGITPEKDDNRMGKKLLAFFQKQNKVTGVASLCAIVAIVCLLAYRHELMRGIAVCLNIRREAIPPVRGEIYDRNMRPLVLHSQKTSLFVTGEGVADNELADKAAHILGSNRFKIRDILRRKRPFSMVARKINEDKAQKIREIDVNHRFKTLYEPVREYPLGKTIASHLLGFTGVDNDGMEGLELLYNNALEGREAGMRYLFGNHRYEFPPKQQGDKLVLNLDSELQRMLKQQIDDGWVEMKHPSIIAIAMDAKRGEILALVVRPGSGKQNRNLFSKIRNRAVTDVFEPGNDIMNLFINAAALEEGIVSADDVTVATAASEGLLGRLGEERLYHYLRALGFGSKTGIDLPGEIWGIMHKPGIHPSDSQGPGYWMAATPIQLLSAFCAIANNGIVMIPHVVSKTLSQDNKVISAYWPHVRTHPLSSKTTEALLSVMAKRSAVGDGEVSIPMVSGSAARYESHYAPGKITLFTLAFLGDMHKIGVILVVDNPSDGEQAKKFSESVMRCIARHGRDSLHASPPATGASLASGTSAAPASSVSIAGYQAETKDTAMIIPEAESTAPTPPQVAKPDDAGTATMNSENITKPNVRKHTVQKGDSFYKLAIQYGSSVKSVGKLRFR